LKAVNLIPADAKRGGGGLGLPGQGPGYAVLAVLLGALVLVTVYVLTSNTIVDRKAKLASLQQQVAQAQAQAAKLTNYADFEKLAQARAETVRQIASLRFDWHAALSDLSKVVPAKTSLQSLLGTVAPGVSVNGAGGNTAASAAGGTGGLRGAIPSPAFEIRGCTTTQDDVARLMSRLRLINGVSRVTLADSQKQDAQATASAVSAKGAASGASSTCGANTPTFDLVVFFGPLQAAAASGAAPSSSQPVSTSSGGASR
jgi:Tfp pilus assembly protein PilN